MVILLGRSNDAYRLYQAMVIFVLPSRIESFHDIGVEAYANGLTVLFSDKVPKEAQHTDNVRIIPLMSGAEYWTAMILKGNTFRKTTNLNLYDIAYQSCSLSQYYEEWLKYNEK